MTDQKKSDCPNASTDMNRLRVIPQLTLKNAKEAIAHYKKALGAEEIYCMDNPKDGTIAHASIKIGETELFVSEETPGGYCAPSAGQAFYIYVPDADAALKKAVDAGCKVEMPLEDMFWGDRLGMVVDPYGVKWNLATHVKDVSEEDMKEGMKKFVSQQKVA